MISEYVCGCLNTSKDVCLRISEDIWECLNLQGFCSFLLVIYFYTFFNTFSQVLLMLFKWVIYFWNHQQKIKGELNSGVKLKLLITVLSSGLYRFILKLFIASLYVSEGRKHKRQILKFSVSRLFINVQHSPPPLYYFTLIEIKK